MTDTRQTNADNGGNERGGFAQDVRQRAIDAYDSARESVSGVGRRAGDAFEDAPLVALAGGIAAGALIAALLPRTRTEEQMFRPAGKRLTGTARAAAQAARDAGTARLQELGLTREAGMETIRSVIQGVGDAARTSTQAAVSTVREAKGSGSGSQAGE